MFTEETVCPGCGNEWELEWPEDEDFICSVCGEDGYWSHFTEEEGQPLHFFWRSEDFLD